MGMGWGWDGMGSQCIPSQRTCTLFPGTNQRTITIVLPSKVLSGPDGPWSRFPFVRRRLVVGKKDTQHRHKGRPKDQRMERLMCTVSTLMVDIMVWCTECTHFIRPRTSSMEGITITVITISRTTSTTTNKLSYMLRCSTMQSLIVS